MIRFANVTIPANSLIKTAKITFNCHQTHTGDDTNVVISGVDADNPAAPISVNEFDALTLTTASVSWDDIENWVQDSNYDSPSILAIIQEITGRSGWASGNAMIIVIKEKTDDCTNQRWFHSINESADVAPILTVTYVTQWANKINTVSTPAKVYGVANASDNYKVNKINTVSR